MNKLVTSEMVTKIPFIFVLVFCVILSGCLEEKDHAGITPSETESQPENQSQQTTPQQSPQAGPDTVVPPQADTGGAQQNQLAAPKPIIPSQPIAPKLLPDGSAPEQTDLSLNQFDSLPDSDAKIDFIMEFADANPELTLPLVDKALNDPDVEVRVEAMDALISSEPTGSEALGVITKALKDNDADIRQKAVEACASIEDPGVSKLLVNAVEDENEDVRSDVIGIADEKDAAVRLKVLKAAVAGRHEDVKSEAISSLIDMSSPDAVDALLPALKDLIPDIRDEANSALSFLLSQDFETYDQWKKFWDSNRKKFDEELTEIEDDE